MRILFVTPFYYPENQFGGPARKIHAISRGVRELCHEVTVLTFHSQNRAGAEPFSMDGVAVEYLPWRGTGLKQWPLDRGRMRHAIRRAELVHCYGIYNLVCPIAALIAHSLNRPFVIEPLGMFPPRAGNQVGKRLYNYLLTKWMVRKARAVIAASRSETEDLRAIVDAEKTVLRRNGIDVEAFARLPSRDAHRASWGISEDEKLVLFVGRLSPIKNLEQMIRAFSSASIPRARLVLVGPGEPAYEAKLRALIAEEKLGERVMMAGPLYDHEQKAALAAADLFVLPSLNESFGNAAGEAVAGGVPVLLTDTCGIASLIHERAGYAVPLGVDNLARGLTKMLDLEFCGRMTGRRDEVMRELSWDEPVAQTLALYERIVRENAVVTAAEQRPGLSNAKG